MAGMLASLSRVLGPAAAAELFRVLQTRVPSLSEVLAMPGVATALDKVGSERWVRDNVVAYLESELHAATGQPGPLLSRVLPRDRDSRAAVLYVLRGHTVHRVIRTAAFWAVVSDAALMRRLAGVRSASHFVVLVSQEPALDALVRTVVWAPPPHRPLAHWLLLDLSHDVQHRRCAATRPLLRLLGLSAQQRPLIRCLGSAAVLAALQDPQVWELLLDWSVWTEAARAGVLQHWWPRNTALSPRLCAALQSLRHLMRCHPRAVAPLVAVAAAHRPFVYRMLFGVLASQRVSLLLSLHHWWSCRRSASASVDDAEAAPSAGTAFPSKL